MHSVVSKWPKRVGGRGSPGSPGTDEVGYANVELFIKMLNGRAGSVWERHRFASDDQPIGINQMIVLFTLGLCQYDNQNGFYAPARLEPCDDVFTEELIYSRQRALRGHQSLVEKRAAYIRELSCIRSGGVGAEW